MLCLEECIRIFTTWQAIPFKRKFYFLDKYGQQNKGFYVSDGIYKNVSATDRIVLEKSLTALFT